MEHFERGWRLLLIAWVLFLAGIFLVYLGKAKHLASAVTVDSPQPVNRVGLAWIANMALAVLGGVLVYLGKTG